MVSGRNLRRNLETEDIGRDRTVCWVLPVRGLDRKDPFLHSRYRCEISLELVKVPGTVPILHGDVDGDGLEVVVEDRRRGLIGFLLDHRWKDIVRP